MSEQDDKLKLRFAGRRFEGARLPVGILPDIEAFRDLLVSFAKIGWLAEHEGRQRVPRGFDAQLSLDLIMIEDGSAVPVLAPSFGDVQGVLPGMTAGPMGLLRNAYFEVAELFHKAANDSDYKPVLRRDQISALNRFGAGLRKDEHIDLVGAQGTKGNVVSITSATRRDLITRIRETYEKRYEGVGTLLVVSADGWIDVSTADYGVLKLSVGERALDEFDGFLLNEVSIEVTLELDADDRVRNVIDTHLVELIEFMSDSDRETISRAKLRLSAIAEMDAGWMDGEGERITSSAIEQAKVIIEFGRTWFNTAGIFPTLDGGIQIENSIDGDEYTFVISPSGEASGLICLSTDETKELPSLEEIFSVFETVSEVGND